MQAWYIWTNLWKSIERRHLLKLGDITVNVKSNLDELTNLINEAKELIQKINDFELEIEVTEENE